MVDSGNYSSFERIVCSCCVQVRHFIICLLDSNERGSSHCAAASLASTSSTRRSACGRCASKTSTAKVRRFIKKHHHHDHVDDDDVVVGVTNYGYSLSAAELCRELSGWPRRAQRSTNGKRCSNLRSNLRSNRKTWANMA